MSASKKKVKTPVKKENNPKVKSEINTGVDQMLFHIKTRKKEKLKFFVKKLGVDEKLVEDWAKILEEQGLIEMNYTPFGGIVLKIIEKDGNDKQDSGIQGNS